MKTPRFTDAFRGRYRNAAETAQPGYLAKRLALYARRERMRAAKQRKNVERIRNAAPQGIRNATA